MTFQFDDFQIDNIDSVDGKTQQGLYGLPAALAGRTGVQCQKLVPLVVLHLQYMAMPAHEQINRIVTSQAFLKPRYEPWIVLARIAAYMRHQHIYFFYPESIELRQAVANFAAVDVAEHGSGRAELA